MDIREDEDKLTCAICRLTTSELGVELPQFDLVVLFHGLQVLVLGTEFLEVRKEVSLDYLADLLHVLFLRENLHSLLVLGGVIRGESREESCEVK